MARRVAGIPGLVRTRLHDMQTCLIARAGCANRFGNAREPIKILTKSRRQLSSLRSIGLPISPKTCGIEHAIGYKLARRWKVEPKKGIRAIGHVMQGAREY